MGAAETGAVRAATRHEPHPRFGVDRTTRRWIAIAALLGLCLRLIFAIGYWTGQPLTRDEREYLSLARSLAAGRGFTYDAGMLSGPVQPFGRAPGYPAFLALTGGGRQPVSTVPISVQMAQSAVGALGVVLAGLIAGRIAGGRAARGAALIAAVYPPLVFLPAYAYSEALFWPVGLLLVLVFDRLAVPGRSMSAVPAAVRAGIVSALGMMIRPALVAFVACAAIWLLAKRRVVPAVVFGAVTLLVLAPWTARNYVHYGRLVLVATEGGVTFWTGNNALAIGEGDMAANPGIKLASQDLRARHPALTEEQMEPVYYREAFAWMRAHPGAWLRLELRKLFYLVVPIGPSYTLHSRRYLLASVLSYGVVLPLAFIGVWRGGSRWRRTPGLWLMFTAAVVVSLAFFPQERFRVPVIDPTLVICAGAAWSRRPAGQPS